MFLRKLGFLHLLFSSRKCKAGAGAGACVWAAGVSWLGRRVHLSTVALRGSQARCPQRRREASDRPMALSGVWHLPALCFRQALGDDPPPPASIPVALRKHTPGTRLYPRTGRLCTLLEEKLEYPGVQSYGFLPVLPFLLFKIPSFPSSHPTPILSLWSSSSLGTSPGDW